MGHIEHAPSWGEVRRAAEINVFGIGLAALWTALNTLLLPGRVADVVPAALRGSSLGLISFLGVGVATLVQPVAGHASDSVPLADRRRPFIWGGTALTIFWLAIFWIVPDFWLLAAAYILLQIGSNGAQAAFQALIPDLVPEERRGLASGVKNAIFVVGVAFGLLGVRLALALTGSATGGLVFLMVVMALSAILTIWWVPVVPPLPAKQRSHRAGLILGLRQLLRRFVAVFHTHVHFARAVLTQFLFLLGVFPLIHFLIYFLQDRFDLDDAAQEAAGALAVAVVLAVAAALIAGALADRFSRRLILNVAIVATGLGVLGIAFGPTLGLVTIAGNVVAMGTGAFLAVMWALLSDDIPVGQGAQFYGLANISIAGASALAGAWGPLLDAAGHFLGNQSYVVAFALAALFTFASLFPLRGLAAWSAAGTGND